MKLLLFSLALIGIILIDVTQADLCHVCDPSCRWIECPHGVPTPYGQLIGKNEIIEKREVGKEEDKDIHIESDSLTCECVEIGKCLRCNEKECDQVSSCNGKREVSAMQHEASAWMMEVFNGWDSADVNLCKCLDQHFCLHKVDGKFQKVDNCRGYERYIYCNAVMGALGICDSVKDGYCNCYCGSCLRCYDDGCKRTKSCKGYDSISPAPSKCQLCEESGCEAVPCLPQCMDESNDIAPLIEHCYCRPQFPTDCTVCVGTQCTKVTSCERFATCKCDMRDNSYRRCYGHKQGKPICRTLGACSDVISQLKNTKREIIAIDGEIDNN